MRRWTRSRWCVRLLALLDRWLGTHLVQQAAIHWQRELTAVQAEIRSLQMRLQELDASRQSILRHLCLSYLQLRQLQSPQGWLHFDPRDPADKSAVDVITRALVTPHWARWKVTPLAADTQDYTYDLVLDWPALHQDALQSATALPANLLNWLEEHIEHTGACITQSAPGHSQPGSPPASTPMGH